MIIKDQVIQPLQYSIKLHRRPAISLTATALAAGIIKVGDITKRQAQLTLGKTAKHARVLVGKCSAIRLKILSDITLSLMLLLAYRAAKNYSTQKGLRLNF